MICCRCKFTGISLTVQSPDANSRMIGERAVPIVGKTLEALGVWACCKINGMVATEFKQLIDGCVREMENLDLKLYIQMWVIQA